MRSPVARITSGAAQGATALALLAAVEILTNRARGGAFSSPISDASSLCVAGALLGAGIGWLRTAPPLVALSPFGIVVGVAIGLRIWLATWHGGTVGDQSAELAVRGGAWVVAGAALGQGVGWVLGRIVPWKERAVRDALIVAALTAPWLLGRVVTAGAEPSDRPNVLLLTVDTLRSDRLGYSGNPRAVSPHLDRLARRGRTHVRAVTTLPRTIPAFATIFTGDVPHAHGVRDNFHYRLGDAAVTLAELFRDAGWTTAAINSNPVLSHDTGIYQGFETASDRGDDWSRLALIRGASHIAALAEMRLGDRADVITNLALDWTRRRSRARPYFLWVHWLEPHMPYEPAYPFATLFDPAYEGEYRGALDYGAISKGDMTYRNPLPERTREHAVALYDGEIATSDRALGKLLRSLEEGGDLRNTWIVFTADHGESLLEHGYFFNHGDFVYGPATNVPLIWHGPGIEPELSVRVPSLTEIVPDILEIVGMPEETDEERTSIRQGHLRFGESGFCRFPDLNDRLGFLLPLEIAQSPNVVPNWRDDWEPQANRAKQRFVEWEEWKLVRSPREEGDRFELFDQRRDPGETTNVAEAHAELVSELRGALDAWIEEGGGAESTAEERTLDEAAVRRLEAMGYLGN